MPHDTEYAAVLRFASEHNGISYHTLDEYTVNGVNLFAIRDGYDFDLLEKTLDKIIAALPALKRVLSRPIMRLSDVSEVLPVESVNVINAETLRHASVHSELWGADGKSGLRPKKLLTLRHEDNYVTYENIAIARAVDTVLKLVSRSVRHLSDVLYANSEMRLNLLERENHLMYFLAVGKLHIGYVRDYEKYNAVTSRCLEKLFFIGKTLSARLKSPVYQKCKPFVSKFVLKKTTTFRVQRDYNAVYRLLRWFNEAHASLDEEETAVGAEEYAAFGVLISLFAVGHFGFAFPKETPLDLSSLDVSARVGKFSIKIKRLAIKEHTALLFTVKKEKTYRILLALSPNAQEREAVRERFLKRYKAEEYLVATPTGEGGSVCLSLFDIETFRRIQRLVLRAMVYADEKRDTCPFCQKPLSLTEDGSGYECEGCRTLIRSAACAQTGEEYFYTSIKGFRAKAEDSGKNRRILREKCREGRMFFRNITAITEDGTPICPHCKRVDTIF